MRWIFICGLLFLVEIYAFQAFKTVIKIRWILYGYEAISLSVIFYIFYSFTQFDKSIGQNQKTLFTMGLLLITLVPKLAVVIVMFGEDIYRLGLASIRYFFNKRTIAPVFPERRKFISQIALGLATIPFTSILYGIFIGKYNFKVIKQTISFKDLPNSFNGFTITQISDIHSGSFDNPEKIKYAIDLINEQKSDMILFTGDIVNTHASEMTPWIKTFKNIKTPKFGKYSILGNHDYGEYINWPSQKAKQHNFEAIKDLHKQIGFELLLNENRFIKKDKDKIVLIGVENWGHNFKQVGDLDKATVGLNQSDFKILMSHDPSHWEYEVKKYPKNIHLTLSGHTHGLQFGIEIPGIFKWSPIQYIYKQWAGLYKEFGKYLYVNRGFGFHAYPGRTGIWPEITVLELKKEKKEL